MKEIYGDVAHVSFIKKNPVTRSAFRHAVVNSSAAVSNFMLSNRHDTPTWSPVGLAAYACAIEAGNLDFVKTFFLDKDAEFEFWRIYHCCPSTFAQDNGSPDIAEWLINRAMEEWSVKTLGAKRKM